MFVCACVCVREVYMPAPVLTLLWRLSSCAQHVPHSNQPRGPFQCRCLPGLLLLESLRKSLEFRSRDFEGC